MNPATRALHKALIRLAKGMITAWEEWLKAQIKEDEERQNRLGK